MVFTAGVYLYYRGKILIVHPTNETNPRKWSIPKGLMEPGEDKYAAFGRELFEETGQVVLKGVYFDLPDSPYPTFAKKPYPSYRPKTLVSALCIVEELADLPLVCESYVNSYDPPFPEVDEFKWVDLEEAEYYLAVPSRKNLEEIKKIIKNHENAIL